MRQIFKSADKEKFFRKYGYIIFELLDQKAMEEISAFYEHEFIAKREVFSFAESLPYYISIFDADTIHKKKVDELISHYVKTGTEQEMINYEVFYSNFMIKFPGDGQIEAHQDFNFVDESIHTAFNLWCPLVDTNEENGGLFVIPGSHNVFRTQRGPNFPNALTKYNQMLKRYAQLVPLKRGQAIVFDHKLIHYSTPNHTSLVRLAIQSVLKPSETDAFHYLFDEQKNQVKALRIDKNFILNNDLWKNNTDSLPVDHEENLIPFPSEDDVIKKLIQLKVENLSAPTTQSPGRSIFKDDLLQQEFDDKGYAKLSILNPDEVLQLKDLFLQYSGGEVSNTDYGMYISLDNGELKERKDLINRITSIVAPRVRNHFIRCKQHLGSFLVKAPGPNSYTYPHQDWTFVSSSEFCSVTVWIALVDTDQLNGTLGFVNGSHKFFNGPVGSPSPEFKTYTQGHEDIFYEYLEWVPLKAGEAVAFNNRTIHGAAPNNSDNMRIAVGIGITAEEAPLCHYYLLPGASNNGYRKIARLQVDDTFFYQNPLGHLRERYLDNQMPEGYHSETILHDEYNPFTRKEIELFCAQAGLKKNGNKLLTGSGSNQIRSNGRQHGLAGSFNGAATRIWKSLFKS